MAFKRYPLRYVKTYRYENPESKEVDEIVFMANGYLFPLFKSLTGVELGDAIADYKKGLLDLVDNDLVEVITKYEGAQTAEDKLKVLAEKPEVVFSALRAAQDTDAICGLSLIDLLLVIMRVCALPESDHAEALAAGVEILPQECFEDPQLALELLMLAIQYDDNAKKNSSYRAQHGKIPK